jgi:hypothetical protein
VIPHPSITIQNTKKQNFIKRQWKWKYHKRKSGGILPGNMEALTSLFKDQLIYKGKAGKIWAVLRKRLWWLAGLINTALSHNIGYSVYILMLISRPLIVCMRYYQYS